MALFVTIFGSLFTALFLAALMALLVYTGVWGGFRVLRFTLRDVLFRVETLERQLGRRNGVEGAQKKQQVRERDEQVLTELEEAARRRGRRPPPQLVPDGEGGIVADPRLVAEARRIADSEGKGG